MCSVVFSYVNIKKITQPSTLSSLLANILDSLCILKVFPTAIVFLVLEVGPRTLERPLLCPIYRHALSTTALYLLTRYLPLRSIYPCCIYHHALSSTMLYLPLCCIYHCAISIIFISSVLRHGLNKLPLKS